MRQRRSLDNWLIRNQSVWKKVNEKAIISLSIKYIFELGAKLIQIWGPLGFQAAYLGTLVGQQYVMATAGIGAAVALGFLLASFFIQPRDEKVWRIFNYAVTFHSQICSSSEFFK